MDALVSKNKFAYMKHNVTDLMIRLALSTAGIGNRGSFISLVRFTVAFDQFVSNFKFEL